MRMRRALIGGAVAAIVATSVAAPIWAMTPATQPVVAAAGGAIPGELYGLLWEKCARDIPTEADQALLPEAVASDETRGEIRMILYRIEETGDIVQIEPSSEQEASIAEVNECLAPYELAPWSEPPQFDAFHRNMYYDYFASVLVPCLTSRDIHAIVPSRRAFEEFDVTNWYQRRIEVLGFEDAFEIWRSCPPVPDYLNDAARRPVFYSDLGP